MPGPDAVRPFQLPTNSPEQMYLSQYNLASNTPVLVTPGFGGSGSGPLPPILLGKSHWDATITKYCDQAQAEVLAAGLAGVG